MHFADKPSGLNERSQWTGVASARYAMLTKQVLKRRTHDPQQRNIC